MESSNTEIDSTEVSEDESCEEQDTYISKYRQISSSEDECSEEEETYLSKNGQMRTSVDENSEETYMSKNREICWSSKVLEQEGPAMVPAQCVLKKRPTPGPTKSCISQAQDIMSTFKLFIPKSMEKIIIDRTNLEGKRRFSKNWQEFTASEFDAFMGLLIMAGGVESARESAISLWNQKTGRTIFRATMTKKRFCVLSNVMRFANPESKVLKKSTDKLAAFRDVWDTWSSNLSIMYNPGHDITIDEHQVPFKGRCPFRENMPHIPSKSDIKLWAACDSRSSYCWKVQVYTGKPPGEETEENLAKRVVLDLSKGLKGQNVTLGSFFTSFDLGQELLKKKLTMTGEVRCSRPELPSDFLISKGRRLHSSKFGFFSNTTIVSYLKKRTKNMLLMSTFHKKPQISDRLDRMPHIVIDYNENKGGVDTMNKLTSAYSTIQKTTHWTLALFCDMLDIAAHNACVVWNEINPEWKTGKRYRRKLFLQELGEALVAPAMQQRTRLIRRFVGAGVAMERKDLPAPPALPASQGKGRSGCVLCDSGKAKQTRVVCNTCGHFACKSHHNIVCMCCIKYC
uniref:PiggyBac transposable element-derived protein 4-like n=1 Tax=Paramormyrops kingsleyae TaxID=1676925 RepID=A0A3B3QYT7_9TELE